MRRQGARPAATISCTAALTTWERAPPTDMDTTLRPDTDCSATLLYCHNLQLKAKLASR